MQTAIHTASKFPTEEIFRKTLANARAVCTRQEIAESLLITPQGVGLWERKEHTPPARRRAFLIKKLTALRIRTLRARRAKASEALAP